MLSGESEAFAKNIFCRLRAGQSPHQIVRSIQQCDGANTLKFRHERKHCQCYLVALLQSTASFWEVFQAASQMLHPEMKISFPSAADMLPPRNTVITLESLGEILTRSNSDRSVRHLDIGPVTSHDVPDTFLDGPLFWVPASPWTDVTVNDRAVSELVSTFFGVINPYWRFLDEAAFIQDMRRKDVDGLYCSPLLVNAVLACASMSTQALGSDSDSGCRAKNLQPFSETDKAFAESAQLLTRGEQYHREAMHLWMLEKGRHSLVNLQALLILAIE